MTALREFPTLDYIDENAFNTDALDSPAFSLPKDAVDEPIYSVNADGELFHGPINSIKRFITEWLNLKINDCQKCGCSYIFDVVDEGGESIYESGIVAVETVNIQDTYGV